jgi:hypothetical protein
MGTFQFVECRAVECLHHSTDKNVVLDAVNFASEVE